jgi:hypothetical protein
MVLFWPIYPRDEPFTIEETRHPFREELSTITNTGALLRYIANVRATAVHDIRKISRHSSSRLLTS